MLRIHLSGSVEAAKGYYSAGLGKGDYYTGAELAGVWCGKAAAMLGLSGEVKREEFHSLCDNLRPDDGKRLTPRMNMNRRVGYDFVFSAPKSVSIAQGVLGDERITAAFQAAVRNAMEAIERDAYVRVRRDGANTDRKTGNLVWGEFTHFTSRPVDGVPDPNLHVHAYCFNVSYDQEEDRFKAGEFFHIKRDAPYFESIFHSKLAEEMQKLGYIIENKPYSFEVVGIGEENIRRFSRRTAEIEALADKLGLTGKAKDGLGAKTRRGKEIRLSEAEIKSEWRNRYDRSGSWESGSGRSVSANEAVEYSLGRNFERRSVVPLRKLVTDAVQFSIGDCSVEEIENAIVSRETLLISDDGVTTEEILAEEEEVLARLERSRGKFAPFNPGYRSSSKDADQKSAIEALANCRDRVIVVIGKAGTGKTTLLKEASTIVGRLFTFAPTSEAAHKVLKSEGFKNSDTVQQLLANPELQSQLSHSILWIDEAGLLSVGEVNRVLQIAEEQNARVVFSGDPHQHKAINRGDGLRLVAESGLVTVKETRKVYRQKNEQYRKAVEQISEGRTLEGIKILNEMGAIVECPDPEKRFAAIAEEYVKSPDSLIISPTHAEGDVVTSEIRKKLKELGVLSGEWEATTHQNRNLTEAERGQALFLNAGDIVRFHQNARGGFKKGQTLKIEHIGKDGRIWLDGGSKLRQLNLSAAKHYQIYREEKLPLAIGDKIRLTRNVTVNGKRLFNGSVHEVVGVGELSGEVYVSHSKLRLPEGSFTHGYVSNNQPLRPGQDMREGDHQPVEPLRCGGLDGTSLRFRFTRAIRNQNLHRFKIRTRTSIKFHQ